MRVEIGQTVDMPDPDRPRRIVASRGRADRAYRRLATGSGLLTLVILFLIGLFLLLGNHMTSGNART